MLNRGKDGKGGNGYADAAEHVPDFVSLMALQAAFLRPQRCHITVIRTPPSRNKLKPLGLSRIEVEQGTRFPLVGAVLRAFGGQAANMEVHRLGLEAFRDLPGHIGWIEPDKPPPVRGEERARRVERVGVGVDVELALHLARHVVSGRRQGSRCLLFTIGTVGNQVQRQVFEDVVGGVDVGRVAFHLAGLRPSRVAHGAQ